jgi:hypothetical protein
MFEEVIKMSRRKVVRVPRKGFLKWLSKNYGVGGFENYTREQQMAILQALALILKNTGQVELEQLGKIMIQLARNRLLLDTVFDEFEKEGIFEMFNL